MAEIDGAWLKAMVGAEVVVDTASPYVFLGTLRGEENGYLLLEDADAHVNCEQDRPLPPPNSPSGAQNGEQQQRDEEDGGQLTEEYRARNRNGLQHGRHTKHGRDVEDVGTDHVADGDVGFVSGGCDE